MKEVLIALIPLLLGIPTIVLQTRKILHDRKIKKELEAENFYIVTASNLVRSAERLNLSGPEKKDYVMTWLENEAINSGVPVDRAKMSSAIEEVILIMNDHRHLDEPVSNIIKNEMNTRTEKKYKEADEKYEYEQGLVEASEDIVNKVKDKMNRL